MSEEDLNRLCTYVAEYSSGDTLQKITPVKVDSQLKSIDIMHFGWNIGKAFGIKRIHTATFIKNVFAHTLRDLEISTIERKMSHTESECYIKLQQLKRVIYVIYHLPLSPNNHYPFSSP